MSPIDSIKRVAGDLAILGGEPLFPQQLHVGRPNIGDRARFMSRLDAILDSRWLTNDGPYVEELEERIREVTGARCAVAVSNATIGLELTARALGLTGEVIVPSFTFVATAHALRWIGLKPVFCEIDEARLTIDPKAVEALITDATSAIVGVHVYGRPCDIPALSDVASAHGLALIFDAAHAFGCSIDGTPIGNHGSAEVFSFHATKFVNSFEGGAVVTNDHALATRVGMMRSFGFVDFDETASDGTNAKLTEVAAAMGITSIESMDMVVATNRRNFEAYAEGTSGIAGLRIIKPVEGTVSNYQYVTMRVGEEFPLSRDRLQEVLVAEGVLARRYFYPGVHKMEPYRSRVTDVSLPITDRVAEEVLCLPTGTAVEATDVAAICDLITLAEREAAAIDRHLANAPVLP